MSRIGIVMPEVEEKSRKRIGRPPKAPEKGRRQNYTFRMSDQTRDSVIEAAAISGRSMSEELEWRIEESFREQRLEVLAKSLLNGSDKLYSMMSRISALASSIENYADANGDRIGSKDWDSHEPTRAGIKAGVMRLVEEMTAPVRHFDSELVADREKEIGERIKAGTFTDEDKEELIKYADYNSIYHMEVVARLLADVLCGRVALAELTGVFKSSN